MKDELTLESNVIQLHLTLNPKYVVIGHPPATI